MPSETANQFQDMHRSFAQASTKVGLQVNATKTKIMTKSRERSINVKEGSHLSHTEPSKYGEIYDSVSSSGLLKTVDNDIQYFIQFELISIRMLRLTDLYYSQ